MVPSTIVTRYRVRTDAFRGTVVLEPRVALIRFPFWDPSPAFIIKSGEAVRLRMPLFVQNSLEDFYILSRSGSATLHASHAFKRRVKYR
jgi:hypothetical protein